MKHRPRPVESLEPRRLLAGVAFGPVTPVSVFTPVDQAFAAQVDDDTALDVVSTGGGLIETSINDGTGRLTTRGGASPPGVVGAITLGDVNNDGHPDLVTATSAQSTAGNVQSYLIGNSTTGTPTFAPGNVGSTVSSPPSPTSAVAADFNSDGLIDLAVAYPLTRTIVIYRGAGGGSFTPQTTLVAGGRCALLIAADVNTDGAVDLIALEPDVNQFEIFLGSSAGTFAAGQQFRTNVGPTGIAAGDLNLDGRPDLVVTVSNGMQTFLNQPNAGGVSFNASSYSDGRSPISPVVIDVTNDDVPDVVVADGASDTLSVFPGLPDGSLNLPVTIAGPANPTSVAAADLNNDGLPDLIVTNGTRQIFTLSNTTLSAGTTSSHVTLSTPAIVQTNTPFTETAVVTWPAGSVTFYDGGVPIGTAAVDPYYHATLLTTVQTSGPHSLTAVWTGDAAHAPAVSTVDAISASPVDGPYLYATIRSATPAYSNGAGNTTTLDVLIQNRGPAHAYGTITLAGSVTEYYAFSTTTRDVVTAPTNNLASTLISLDPGQSVELTGTASVPSSAYANGYRFTISVVPLTGLTAANIAAGDTINSQPLYSPSNPPPGTDTSTAVIHSLIKLSTGAMVSLKLKGYGSGGFVDGGNGTVSLRLTGTTSATIATIGVRGHVTLSSLLVASNALEAFIAPGLDFDAAAILPDTVTKLALHNAVGSLSTASVLPLTAVFAAATNFTFTDLGPMGSLAAAAWSGSLSAQHIGKLFVRADYTGDLRLTDVNAAGTSVENATVGSIGPGTWSAPGRFGSLFVGHSVAAGFSASFDVLGPVLVRGDFLGTVTANSVDVFHVDGGVSAAVVTSNGVIKSLYVGKSVLSSTFTAGARIGLTVIGGVLSGDSKITAPVLPVTVTINRKKVKTTDDPRFGS